MLPILVTLNGELIYVALFQEGRWGEKIGKNTRCR